MSRMITLKGKYGSATITEEGGTLNVVVHCADGEVIEESYTGRFVRDYGCAQTASTVGHGVDAEMCTDGSQGWCPHVEVS